MHIALVQVWQLGIKVQQILTYCIASVALPLVCDPNVGAAVFQNLENRIGHQTNC